LSPRVMAISKNIVNSINHFASWWYIASDKRNETHFLNNLYKKRMLSWYLVDWIEMTYICDLVFVQNDFFKWYWYTKKRWKSILKFISKFPTFLAFVITSNSVTLSCHSNCFFKHLIKDIIIFDTYTSSSLYKCQCNLQWSQLSFIHHVNQLKSWWSSYH
jgi:hypothetical protein